MKRKDKSAGRRCEIKEETARATFNLTAEQVIWIHEMADRNGNTASKFMRQLLQECIEQQRKAG